MAQVNMVGKEGENAGCTLLITGFPETTSDREMDNYCRFMPGFVGSKSKFKTWPMVFVKFDHPQSAAMARDIIDRQPFDVQDDSVTLKAHIANSELQNPGVGLQFRKGRGPSIQAGPLHALLGIPLASPESKGCWEAEKGGRSWDQGKGKHGKGSSYKGSGDTWEASGKGVQVGVIDASWEVASAAKRQRFDVPDAGMDTICIMGCFEKGLTEETLKSYFASVEGYLTLQISRGTGHCFVKFSTHAQAVASLDIASNLEPQMARRSLSMYPSEVAAVGGGHDVGYQAQEQALWSTPLSAPAVVNGKGKGPGKQAPEDPSTVDTICILGADSQGLTETALGQFFEQLEGFTGLRMAPGGKSGGLCFVKFGNNPQALIGIQAAKSQNLDVQMARTSMNPSQATYRAMGNGGFVAMLP